MPSPARRSVRASPPPTARTVLARLRAMGSAKVRAGYARFGLAPTRALGIAMPRIQRLAKELGPRHDLVDALWASGIYEARLLVAYLGEPQRLTALQMERWCRDFDNWGVTDTLCFVLFDRSPRAFAQIAAWRTRRPEFEKRAAFALLASVALHDKAAADAPFVRALGWIRRAATDPRNFVKKGVLWALRGVGGRNAALHGKALALADELAAATDPTARWVGREAARELRSPATRRRIARRG
ncbi:MAG: DNA alkylation repair protein [Planctomycetes bacterium]|nr:DNA alkylation repair protein [Planctomycetota bacterium]